MPLTIEQFTERLMSSGVMSDEQLFDSLAAVARESAEPADGEQLARELVKQKRLTKFQAEQIYAGKEKSLTLGNYLLLDKLGQGGMGMVLKARHKRMGRVVALKVMSPAAVKSKDAVKRFHREVQTAAKLTHPNIVTAFDADEAKGTHFLVMEYVEGDDLSQLVKKHGALSVEQAIECVIQAARGLAHAHAEGVIHRDIKPANLLLDKHGTVKILDMGLARLDSGLSDAAGIEGAGLTQSGTIMGTVDYMSPEQAEDTRHADARADIYSLGCSLFYLLTGRVVYDGETMMKKLLAHRDAPIPSLADAVQRRPVAPRQESRTSSDVGSPNGGRTVDAGSAIVSRSDTATLAALDFVFRRMVAKRPEDRSQSMTEVIAELERCLSGGSPTVAIVQSRSNATKALANGASGSGNELQDFLRQISGGEPATEFAGKASGTIKSPSCAESETMISSANGAGTDPRTEQSLTIEVSRTRSQQQKKTVVFGCIAAAVVILLGIVFVVLGKSGTLHLEIADELIEVTVGDTGRKVTGKKKHTLRVPLGELVLRVQREDIAFDTDSFDVIKGDIVTVKVERIGRRVRAVMGNTLLGHKEDSPPKRSSGTKSGDVRSLANRGLEFQQGDIVTIPSLTYDGGPLTVEMTLHARGGQDLQVPFSSHGKSKVVFWGRPQLQGVTLDYGGSSVGAKAALAFPTGKTIRLAGVFDNQRLTYFLDGQLLAVGVANKLENKGEPGAAIGGIVSPGSFVGLMYELRVSKIARYSGDYAPPDRLTRDTGTLALYQFDEGTGSILNDRSGNNHHGKIVGTKWVTADEAAMRTIRETAVTKITPHEKFPVLKGHEGPIKRIRFLPDGKHFVSVAWDQTARLWNVETGEQVRKFSGAASDKTLNNLALSPDRKLLAVGGSSYRVYLFDVATGQQERFLQFKELPSMGAMAFTRDGQSLFVANARGVLHEFESANGNPLPTQKLFELRASEIQPPPQVIFDQRISVIEPLPDNERLLVAAHVEKEFVLWHRTKKEIVQRFVWTEPYQPVRSLAVLADGQRVASAHDNNLVRIWSLETGKELKRWAAHPGKGIAATGIFSLHNDRWLLTIGDDKAIRLWDGTTFEKLDEATTELLGTGQGAVSPDGRTLVTGAGWRLTTQSEYDQHHDLHVWRLPVPPLNAK